MSTPQASAVVAPTTEGGKMDMANAAGVTKMSGGGYMLTPLPLAGGKRKSRKISKKVLKQLKKMGAAKVSKMLKKGGAEEMVAPEASSMEETGGRRRKSGRKTRRASRKSRRGFFY
jgi:hypothetical protein